jgi:hypothetical protein
MNPKIRQLAEQVNIQADPDKLEKFAQEIIKELTSIVLNQGAYMRYNHLADRIKQHFESTK